MNEPKKTFSKRSKDTRKPIRRHETAKAERKPLTIWTFTDVFEENRTGDTVFHGGFGLINHQKIVKPAFHTYRFMNELGDG
jgi:beta-xylosidase